MSTLIDPVGTLFGLPAGRPTASTLLAVLGVPFDMGYHPTRVGSRSGPTHVRLHSALVAEHLDGFDVDVLAELGAVDVGDVRVRPGDVAESFPAVQAAVLDLLAAGVTPLTFGGDGAVTLPQLRAAREHLGAPVAVLHLDAHTDAYRGIYPYEYNNANTFIHAVDEGLIDLDRSMHIGMRDTEYAGTPGVVGVARDLGYDVVTMSEIEEVGIPALLGRVRDRFAGAPVYLCWDMDVFDPSVSPGVVTPSWGGLTLREGLSFVRGLRGLDFASFDINTVSPPHDPNGQTGALAAQIAVECAFLRHAMG